METPPASDRELRRLGSHWARFWAGCDPASAADEVRARLDAAVVAWGLDGLEVLAGGVVALVCGARRHGEPVVVKVHPRVAGSEALRFEGDALAFWVHTGAVARLYDRRDDGFTLLLERLLPGRRLEAVGLDVVECLSEMGRLAARLHSAGPPPAEWALPGPAPDPTACAHPVVRAALDRLGNADPRGNEALLHGDLHARNVLLHGTSWRVIDPHGQRGDRHAEVWPLLEASAAFPAERDGDGRLAWTWVEAYAGAAELDAERVAAWSASWHERRRTGTTLERNAAKRNGRGPRVCTAWRTLSATEAGRRGACSSAPSRPYVTLPPRRDRRDWGHVVVPRAPPG